MKIYILKWLSTGQVAKTAYTNRKKAEKIAANANKNRTFLQKMFVECEWHTEEINVK